MMANSDIFNALNLGSMQEALSGGFLKLFRITIRDVGRGMADTLSKNIIPKKLTKKLKKISKTAGPLIGAALDIFGIFLQILDAMGVLQPIMQLFQGVLDMIGGTVMQTLAPAMQHLADVLFSPDLMGLWKLLGFLIGVVLSTALNTFASVLKALSPLIKVFVALMGGHFAIVIILIIKAIGILLIAGFLPLIIGIYAIGLAVAAIIDVISFFTGQKVGAIEAWNNMMLPVIAGLAIGMGEVIMMGTGGYIPPSTGGTLAIIGEGGEGEFVVPESKMGGIGNKDMLYATEDNGDKLDKIIFLLSKGGLV